MTTRPKLDNKPLLLAGYFGHGNAGDEMILQVLRETLGPTVYLSGPLPRWPGAVPRFHPTAVLKALRDSRGLVMGGGELFQSRTSLRSLIYYLSLPWLAKFLGKPVAVHGLALDPDLPKKHRQWTARALAHAKIITVRDLTSQQMLAEEGVPSQIAPDIVWSWPNGGFPPLKKGGEGGFAFSSGSSPILKKILWILRVPKNEFSRSALLHALKTEGPWQHGLMMFHPSEDAPGLGWLRSHLPFFHTQEHWTTPSDLLEKMANWDLVVTMRYHGLVAASLVGRPALALSHHGKVQNLAESLKIPSTPLENSFQVSWPTLFQQSFANGPVSPTPRPIQSQQALQNLLNTTHNW